MLIQTFFKYKTFVVDTY